MITIPLSQNRVALIDDADSDLVTAHKWHVMVGKYAATRVNGKVLYLHRLLMNPPNNLVVDHINGDGFDNRRCNLRVVTHQQNIMNRTSLNKNNSSGHRGVAWDKSVSKWISYVTVEGKRKTLGVFKDKNVAIAKVHEVNEVCCG